MIENMKFKSESPEHSAAIQMALFNAGVKWNGINWKIMLVEHPYLYADWQYLSFSEDDNGHFFARNDNQIHSLVKGQIVEGDHKWDGFIPWFGGRCPIYDGALADVIFGSGRHSFVPVSMSDPCWKLSDVIAYKVVAQAAPSTAVPEAAVQSLAVDAGDENA